MTSAALLAALSLLAACTPPAPPDPATKALERQFEMGCRSTDSNGYEGDAPYCGGV